MKCLGLLTLATLALALSSCGSLSQASVNTLDGNWTARVHGHSIVVRFYTRGAEGYSGFAFNNPASGCSVYVNARYLPSPVLGHVLAHEVGHCLDHLELGWSHNGFSNQGARWGTYYSDPAEGFAEAFAVAYTKACGDTHAALLDDDACIPLLTSVRP